MGKKLAVIIGAGASFDLIPLNQGNEISNVAYRPPLTDQLFNLHPHLQTILNTYPKAHTAIGILKGKLAIKRKKPLEELLRELKESEQESQRQQFRQLPLLLQRLFGRMSLLYCHHPINYASLVSITQHSNISEVAYITLNYDLFLEHAIQAEYIASFDRLENYIPADKKWKLIKLHGSANWGRKIKDKAIRNGGSEINALLENVAFMNLDNDLQDQYLIDKSYRQEIPKATSLYPALSVPVDGEYKMNCPPEHLEAVKKFLKDCQEVLIIGISGRDQDLLELLNDSLPPSFTMNIVSHDNVEEVADRFRKVSSKMRQAGYRTYNRGFSDFIESGELENLVSQLK